MKKLPHTWESESAILGSFLQDSDQFYLFPDLKSKYFDKSINKKAFSLICDIMKEHEKVDLVSFVAEAERLGISNIDYSLAGDYASHASYNLKYHIEAVKDSYSRKKYLTVADRMQTIGLNSDKDILQETEKLKQFLDESIADTMDEKPKNSKQLCEELFEDYIARKDLSDKGASSFLPTNLPFFEFEKNELITIAACPGVGKSMLAINIACDVAKWRRTLFFSFEMSSVQVMHRMMAYVNNSSAEKFRYVEYTHDELAGMIDQFNRECPHMQIFDKTITMDEIEAIARAEKQKKGDLDLVVIDYPNISADNQTNLVEKSQYVTRKAKQIAQNLGCCVIVMNQFNQEGEKVDFPRREHLLGGSSIVQNSSQIFILHNPTVMKQNSGAPKESIYILRKVKDRYSAESQKDYLLDRPQDTMAFRQTTQTPNWIEND